MSPEGSAELLAPRGLDVPGSDALASRLFPALPSEVEWGLDRIRALLDELGDPHLARPSLHVGGTNGKGTVAALWASVLRADGLRVGLYTSPHLDSFRERYRVDGVPLGADALEAAAAEIRDGVVRHGLTLFEAATVLAFHLFHRRGVDVTVAEVGLGGRLDATNVLRPEVAAVTNVTLDHCDYLGDELPEIAREKAGIVKAGVPFVTAESSLEILEIFRAAAEAVDAPFHRVDSELGPRNVVTSLEGTRLTVRTRTWGDLSLETRLVGRHQALNVALAVRGLDLLDEPLRPGARTVVEGVARLRWPGRLQVEKIRGRTWIFDVAHNPAGIRALAETLREQSPPRPWSVVVGILGDKEWRSMLPPLFASADRAFLTQAPTAPAHRRWDPEEAAAAIRSPLPMFIVPELDEALAKAEKASAPGGTVVVTGSHYTVGAALRSLGRLPYRRDG